MTIQAVQNAPTTEWPYILAVQAMLVLLAFFAMQPKFDFYVDLGFLSLRVSSGQGQGQEQASVKKEKETAALSVQEEEQQDQAASDILWQSAEDNVDAVEGLKENSTRGNSKDNTSENTSSSFGLLDLEAGFGGGDAQDSSKLADSRSSTSASESSLCKKLTRMAEAVNFSSNDSPNSEITWSSNSSPGSQGFQNDSLYRHDNAALPHPPPPIHPPAPAFIPPQVVNIRTAAVTEFQPGTGWLRPHGNASTSSMSITRTAKKRPAEDQFMYRAISQLQCAFDAMEEDVGQVDKTAQDLEVEVIRLAAEVEKLKLEVKGLKGAMAVGVSVGQLYA